MTTIVPQDHYEVDQVFYVDEIAQVVQDCFGDNGKPLLFLLHGRNTESGNFSNLSSFEGLEKFDTDLSTLHPVLTECRVIKSDLELGLIKYVNDVGSEAHIEVMRQASPGMKEYQLESIFRHHAYMYGGCRNCSYTCICATGDRRAVLHYGHVGAPNDRTLNDGDMTLIDMGAEYHFYASAITCVFPINGKFNRSQTIIYDAVLKAHNAVISQMWPGVKWMDMQKLAERAVLESLRKEQILQGDVDDMMTQRIGAVFMPHDLGHLHGIDTHDAGFNLEGLESPKDPGLSSLRTTRELKEGMIITVKPGCYFIDALLTKTRDDPISSMYFNWQEVEKYKSFGGVRIESDVYVTVQGCQNLTNCPREIWEIEAVMAGAPWPVPASSSMVTVEDNRNGISKALEDEAQNIVGLMINCHHCQDCPENQSPERAAASVEPPLLIDAREKTPSPTRPCKRHRGRSTPPSSQPTDCSDQAHRRSRSNPPSPDRTRGLMFEYSQRKDQANDILGPVAIFWDIENCSVPKDFARDVPHNVRWALSMHSGSVAKFSAYGDFDYLPSMLKDQLQSAGVQVFDVPHDQKKDAADKAILVDMLLYAHDSRLPASIMLISGDVDFAPALHGLRQRGYTTIIAIPSPVHVSSYLTNAGSFVWDWPSLARGKGIVIPKSLVSTGDLEVLRDELIHLLASTFEASLPFSKIPTEYHKRYKRQLFLSHYGVLKMSDLFEKLGDSFLMWKGVQEKNMVVLNTLNEKVIEKLKDKGVLQEDQASKSKLPTSVGNECDLNPLLSTNGGVGDECDLNPLLSTNGGGVHRGKGKASTSQSIPEFGANTQAGKLPIAGPTVVDECGLDLLPSTNGGGMYERTVEGLETRASASEMIPEVNSQVNPIAQLPGSRGRSRRRRRRGPNS